MLKISNSMLSGAPNRWTVTSAVLVMLCLIYSVFPSPVAGGEGGLNGTRVPILLYHRFGPAAVGNTTVTVSLFESHLKYLNENGFTVIPLRRLLDYYRGNESSIPDRSVVITADDAHKSVFTEMFPLLKKYKAPATLFIYPSAVSNASYAMTWDHLRELKKSGLFDVQSHTYWHPNFKTEKRRLSKSEYDKFVENQLEKSRQKIEKELGVKVEMIAWPFGIYDEELIHKASDSGYTAAFSIERRPSGPQDEMMALPRYLIVEADRGRRYENIVRGSFPE